MDYCCKASASMRESSNMSIEMDLECSRSSTAPSDENCQATQCCSSLLHQVCQGAAARPVTLTSSSPTPSLSKTFAIQPKSLLAGAGRGSGVWLIALFCFLFQLNLQALLFLAVPLRFSRQFQSFNVISTNICQIGF